MIFSAATRSVQSKQHSLPGNFPRRMCRMPITPPGSASGFDDDELKDRRSSLTNGHKGNEQDDLSSPLREQLSLKENTPEFSAKESKKRGVDDIFQISKRVCLEVEGTPSETGVPEDTSRVTSTTFRVVISLADLPNELLTMIYGYVQKTVDVVHLSMTNRSMHGLLSPKIMMDTYIQNKAVWSINLSLPQQYRLGQLSLGVWTTYMAEEHLLALKLQGPSFQEKTEDEDVEMTDSLDSISHSDAGQMVAKANGQWRHDVCAPAEIVINPLFGTIMQPHFACNPTLDQATRWMNRGPLASHTDAKSGRTLVSYMQKSDTDVRIMICSQTNCSEVLAVMPETFWRPTTESLPVATNATLPPAPLSKLVQIMSMKFYPPKNPAEKMRVLIVLAFGRGNYNAGVAAANYGTQDNNLLDIWEVVKVIEIYISDTPRTVGASPQVPTPGRTEIIVLNSHQDALRGRVIEIYNTPAASAPSSDPQPEPVMEDRIALIGLRQYSERGNANVVLMKCQLFLNPPNATPGTTSRAQSKWVCHVLATHGLAGVEATCMSLFPSRSPLEHLVAILDRTGRGEVWDWINVRRVSILSLADVQATVSETATSKTTTGNALATTSPRPIHSLLIPRKCSDGTPYTPLQFLSQTHHHLQQRKNRRQGLHYWGIHASFAMELKAHGEDEAPDWKYGDIRLVAMADGTDRQSEVSWWHIDQEQMCKHLQAIQDLTMATATNNATATMTRPSNIRRIPPLEIRSSGRHFEYQTLSKTITFHPDGQSFRKEIGKTVEPLQTNAFLVWENYRIMLTVKNGLCIVDMDQEPIGDILPPLKMTSVKEKELQSNSTSTAATVALASTHGTPEVSRRGLQILEEDTLPTAWVTLLDNAEQDPITDISTVDDCLLVTRMYSHLLWPFRELVSKLRPSSLSSSSSSSSSFSSQPPASHQAMNYKTHVKTC